MLLLQQPNLIANSWRLLAVVTVGYGTDNLQRAGKVKQYVWHCVEQVKVLPLHCEHDEHACLA